MITTTKPASPSTRLLVACRQQTRDSETNRAQSFTCFPKQYLKRIKLRGIEITFRAIQPSDEAMLIEFHKTLSVQSVHFRYFGAVSLRQRTIHERLRRHCGIDQTREFALVADRMNPLGLHEILGVGRLFKDLASDEAEFAILVSDAWQGKGIGTHLLKLLARIGRENGLQRISGHILADNLAMTRVSRKAGFSLRFDSSIGEWLAELRL